MKKIILASVLGLTLSVSAYAANNEMADPDYGRGLRRAPTYDLANMPDMTQPGVELEDDTVLRQDARKRWVDPGCNIWKKYTENVFRKDGKGEPVKKK